MYNIDMIINDEEIDFSGPPVNPGIRTLWDINNTGYAHHARACGVYSHWMVGSDDRQIAAFFNVSTEEIRADLAHIKALLPEETIALHVRERDDILAATERSKKVREELAADLSQPIDVLIERGINPIDVMQRFRQAVEYEAPSNIVSDLAERDVNIYRDGKEGEITEDPSQVKELWKRDANQGCDAGSQDLSDEEERELIATLRQKTKRSVKTANMEEFVRPDPTEMASIGIDELKNAFDPRNESQGPSNPVPARSGKKRSPRITLRMNDDLHARILKTAQALDVDLSTIVRELIERGLESESDAGEAATSLSILPEAFQYSAPFRAWCGDLRPEFKKRFLILIALGHEASQRWRTEWVRKLYLALLPIQKYLEDEGVGQRGK